MTDRLEFTTELTADPEAVAALFRALQATTGPPVHRLTAHYPDFEVINDLVEGDVRFTDENTCELAYRTCIREGIRPTGGELYTWDPRAIDVRVMRVIGGGDG